MFYFKNQDLRGKNVLITGGALGMGRCLAELLLMEGCRVAVVDIREKELQDTCKEFAALGEVMPFVCDISARKNVYAMAEKVQQNFGEIDILLNVAGIVKSQPFDQKDDAFLQKIVDVNLMAIMWTTKAFLPAMKRKGQGNIVNFASAGGQLGVPSSQDYKATKVGVVGFTEALRQEMVLEGFKGIKFTYVCPNTVNTGMFKGATAVKGTKMLTADDVCKAVVRGIKNGRGMVGVPFSVYQIPLVKAILPIPVMDLFCRTMGIAQSSASMTGRN